MLLGLAMTLSLAAAPQAQYQTVARRPANAAPISRRLYANESLNRFLRDQQDRDQRQAVIDQRANLADQLDRLIGSGNCSGAKEVALRYGYSDIMNQVDVVCEARGMGTDHDAQAD